jgi:hypothetical protein
MPILYRLAKISNTNGKSAINAVLRAVILNPGPDQSAGSADPDPRAHSADFDPTARSHDPYHGALLHSRRT